MKRFGLFLLTFVLLMCSFVVSAAAAEQEKEQTVFEVVYEGKNFTVDLVAQTIAYDDVVCRFEIVEETDFLVTYPDGSTYLLEQAGGKGEASSSDDYDANRYVSGETLWNVLGRQTSQPEDGGRKLLIAWVFIIIGALNLISPKTWWKLCYGWWSKEKEPNAVMLNSSRVIGVVAIVIGFMFYFN